MENLYQTPSESCSSSERWDFWVKVIADQSTSGISTKKFCKLHQLKYTTFKGYKYKRKKKKINRSNASNKSVVKNIQSDNCSNKFVQLQIATEVPVNEHYKNEPVCNEASEIHIVFKNKHKMILPSSLTETHLLSIVKIVAELQC